MPNYKSTPQFCAVYNQPGSGNSAAACSAVVLLNGGRETTAERERENT
ncbi:MAG: hypothetical protein WA821_18825 [Anaerolineales bacterium]